MVIFMPQPISKDNKIDLKYTKIDQIFKEDVEQLFNIFCISVRYYLFVRPSFCIFEKKGLVCAYRMLFSNRNFNKITSVLYLLFYGKMVFD